MTYLYPPPGDVPVIVMKDVGGYVSQYGEQTQKYYETNREVRLHECRSACTLALSLPNVCVYPSSLLKFHKAYDSRTKIANEEISEAMMNAYPVAVRERLGQLTRQYKVLTGSELIRLGIRDCNKPLSPNYAVARARVRESAPDNAVSNVFGSMVAALTPAATPPDTIPVRARPVKIQTAEAVPAPVPLPPPRPEPLTESEKATAPAAVPAETQPPAQTPAAAPVPPPPASNWGRPIIGSAPILLTAHFSPYPYRAARKG